MLTCIIKYQVNKFYNNIQIIINNNYFNKIISYVIIILYSNINLITA